MEIRCSGLSRPMVCAGSLFFKDLPKSETNAAAEEGTAAGEYLRFLLEKKEPTTHASNGIAFDQDMKFYTAPIAEEILSNTQTEVLCEQRIDWVTRSGIKITGSYDASFIRDGVLYIDDLKYGWGLVEVKENWQLLGYAIGEVIRRQTAFDKIVMRIHQPRPHHEEGSTRTWTLSYTELIEYKEKIEKRMEDIAGGLKTLVTGDKCKYCPAAGSACPAFNKAFFRGIEISHEFLQDDIDEKELSFQLDLVNRVNEVLKIKLDSLNALAVDRIKKGKVIPNYITEDRYGDRKWKSMVTPETFEILTGKKIVEQVMLSPAKAEKMGVAKEFVNSLVDRQFLGQKLVKKDANLTAEKIFGKGNL